YAVVSTGGVGSPAFLTASIEAFVGRETAGGVEQLHVFAALGASAKELADLEAAARSRPVEVHEFAGDFTGWLEAAALSVSRCGYNTSAALLRSRVPAVVVPARGIADQSMRAEILDDLGLAVAVDGEHDDDVDALRAAMASALAGPRPTHDFDLDG